MSNLKRESHYFLLAGYGPKHSGQGSGWQLCGRPYGGLLREEIK